MVVIVEGQVYLVMHCTNPETSLGLQGCGFQWIGVALFTTGLLSKLLGYNGFDLLSPLAVGCGPNLVKEDSPCTN